MLNKIAEHPIATEYGHFLLSGYSAGSDDSTILVLRTKKIVPEKCLLRVQYSCLNATVFRAIDCDCGAQIHGSLRQISELQSGIFIYFGDHEAHGLGLSVKLRAMELEKRKGKPFWKILRSLGFSAEQVHSLDVEKMMVVPTILRDLGVNSGIFLLADSAGKLRACRKAGIEVKEVLSTGALSPVW